MNVRILPNPTLLILVAGALILAAMVRMIIDMHSWPDNNVDLSAGSATEESGVRKTSLKNGTSSFPLSPDASTPAQHSDWFAEIHQHVQMPTERVSLESLPSAGSWRNERGYGLDDYDSYGENTLREMAATGDAIAQYELGRRWMRKDPAASLALNFDATVDGFTSSITTIAIMHRLIAEGRLSASSAPRWRPGAVPEEGALDTNPTTNLIQAYAWGLVAQMRGDPTGMNLNKDLEKSLAELNDDQLQSACTLANETYRDLEQRRASSGLRPFDNAPPPLATVDLSQAGANCGRWPVSRPSCEPRHVTMGSKLVVVYECSG